MKTAIFAIAMILTTGASAWQVGDTPSWMRSTPVQNYRAPAPYVPVMPQTTTTYRDSSYNVIGTSRPNMMGGHDYRDSSYNYLGSSSK